MTEVTFSIRYRAEWQQSLCISGSVPELGNWDESKAIELSSSDNEVWTGHVSLDGRRKDFSYYYLVKDKSGRIIRREWKRMHRLLIKEPFHTIYMDDHWIDRPANSPFYSSAYYDVLFAHKEQNSHPVVKELTHEKLIFQTYAPTVPRNKQLYLLGSIPSLGSWDSKFALPMSYMGKGQWYGSIPIDRDELSSSELHFKHFIADDQKQGIRWEQRDNREFTLPNKGLYDAIYVAGMSFDEGEYSPHFAGTVCPLFSMRHPEDFGVGDFGSLRHAVDWASKASLHILQLLPINDTTFYRDERDSYPYNAISVDAIHPIYLDLGALPPLRNQKLARKFEAEAKKLRKSPTLIYPEVLSLKDRYFRQHFAEHGTAEIQKKGFRSFIQSNKTWLYPYVAFCILRDRNPNRTFREWGEYSHYDSSKILRFIEHAEQRLEASYYLYQQYILSQQLSQVCAYAAERGVLLKGDLPIGVAPHSLEVWVYPELFHTDRSAGAPPDAFATDGQNWGFPTYNWEKMYEDNLMWWRNRFSRMSTYFKAFRIDHVLGFFRIWEIPRTQISGLLGHFSPALPLAISFWQEQFPQFKSIETLVYPCITREDAQVLFGDYLASLLNKQYLLPVEGDKKYYRLAHGKQKTWLAQGAELEIGGQETIDKIVELCKEVALIQDMSQNNLYHPRISFEQTKLFRSWPEEVQQKWLHISHLFFYETHNELWKRTAYQRIVPLLECTDMLVCAEDLGMIPASVPEVLNQLEILSLDLERMPKDITSNGWVNPRKLPYNSICTTSTHDMPPLRLWWKELGRERQGQYLAEQLTERMLTPDSSPEDIFTSIVSAHIASPAMFVVLPIQDWMSIDASLYKQKPEEEQINHPEDPHQYWNYRLPIDMIEAQNKYRTWTKRIREMLQVVGRE